MSSYIRRSPLNELRNAALHIAEEHGFQDATVGEDLALIHSEVSEALEDYRQGFVPAQFRYLDKNKGEFYDKQQPNGEPMLKPVGIPSEMADIVIRVLHFCGKHGIDLERAVFEKMRYNETRPFKHGKKL